MAIISDEEAIKLIANPSYKGEIEKLKELCKEYRAYVTGIDIKSYIPRIPQYEREELFREREKMMLSLVDLLGRILKPRNRIYSAKGGGEHFIISDKNSESRLRQYLDNVTQGLSLKGWIQQVAMRRNDYDPNGIILIEVDSKGRCYPAFKSILDIHGRELNGRTPEYLILKLSKNEVNKLKKNKVIDGRTSENAEIYRFIDDATDRLFSKDKLLKSIKSFSAPKFPGIVSSNIYGDEDDVFNSSLTEVFGLMKQYLLRSSLYNVVFARQAYPKEWMQRTDCPTCQGTGVLDGGSCPECHGLKVLLSLKHSDTFIVDKGDEANKNVPIPPMGNVESPIDTLEFFDQNLEGREDKIHYCIWGMYKSDKISSVHAGITREAIGSNVEPTAYQAMLNSQPMVTQLVEFSKWYIGIYKFSVDIIGTRLFAKNYRGSAIRPGDRFMIESPDATWDRYLKAVQAEAPISELNSILIEYLENKYCNDINQYRKYMLLMGVEPFLHVPVEVVLGWDIPEIQKKEKIYYSEWVQSLSDWEFITIADGVQDEMPIASTSGGGVTSGSSQDAEGETDNDQSDFENQEVPETVNPIVNLKNAFRKWVLAKLQADEPVLPRVVVESKSGLPIGQVASLPNAGVGAAK